jgi:hypothetical protein
MSPRPRSPLVCPFDGSPLTNLQVIPLGQVTARLSWELHAGRSEKYGCWFQAEIISKPPREIFAVSRPAGIAYPILIGDTPIYALPTIWDSTNRLEDVDPYDPAYWAIDWSRLPDPAGHEIVVNADRASNESPRTS